MATALNGYLAQIRDAYANRDKHRIERPSDGFYTAKEWAKHLKVGQSTARRMLLNLVEDGGMERKYFTCRTGDVVRPVPHYRVVQMDKKK